MAGSSHSVALWNMELQLSETLLKIILVSAEREVRGGCGESGQEEIKELPPIIFITDGQFALDCIEQSTPYTIIIADWK